MNEFEILLMKVETRDYRLKEQEKLVMIPRVWGLFFYFIFIVCLGF